MDKVSLVNATSDDKTLANHTLLSKIAENTFKGTPVCTSIVNFLIARLSGSEQVKVKTLKVLEVIITDGDVAARNICRSRSANIRDAALKLGNREVPLNSPVRNQLEEVLNVIYDDMLPVRKPPTAAPSIGLSISGGFGRKNRPSNSSISSSSRPARSNNDNKSEAFGNGRIGLSSSKIGMSSKPVSMPTDVTVETGFHGTSKKKTESTKLVSSSDSRWTKGNTKMAITETTYSDSRIGSSSVNTSKSTSEPQLEILAPEEVGELSESSLVLETRMVETMTGGGGFRMIPSEAEAGHNITRALKMDTVAIVEKLMEIAKANEVPKKIVKSVYYLNKLAQERSELKSYIDVADLMFLSGNTNVKPQLDVLIMTLNNVSPLKETHSYKPVAYEPKPKPKTDLFSFVEDVEPKVAPASREKSNDLFGVFNNEPKPKPNPQPIVRGSPKAKGSLLDMLDDDVPVRTKPVAVKKDVPITLFSTVPDVKPKKQPKKTFSFVDEMF
ncbi:hypothetical protein PCE1_003931 [Barthelona sp. PCE]